MEEIRGVLGVTMANVPATFSSELQSGTQNHVSQNLCVRCPSLYNVPFLDI